MPHQIVTFSECIWRFDPVPEVDPEMDPEVDLITADDF